MIVGLTGGIGSGKSAAAAVFERLGVGCVDADRVAREVVEPGEPALAAIADHFGPAILDATGRLDRAALRQRIFSDTEARAWLEALLHPRIRERMAEQLADLKSPYRLLVAPLLFENGLEADCEVTVLVDVPEDVQIERVLARDGGDRDTVRAIIERQMSRAEKRRRADCIIDNSDSLEDLEASVLALHRRFMAKLAAHPSRTEADHDH